jgi:hypothetical protein
VNELIRRGLSRTEAKTWFEEKIDTVLAFAPKGVVDVHLYVTGESSLKVENEHEKALSRSTTDSSLLLYVPT